MQSSPCELHSRVAMVRNKANKPHKTDDIQKLKKEKLIALLEKGASRLGVYASSAVAIGGEPGVFGVVDYMTFSPSGTEDISGIEKGVFTCYMVRTSYKELYSDESLNFVGERNYLVTTADVYARIVDDEQADKEKGVMNAEGGKLQKHIQSLNPEAKCHIGADVGILVAVRKGESLSEACSRPAEFDPDEEYTLICAEPCSNRAARRHGMTEMLFLMLRAYKMKAGRIALRYGAEDLKNLQLNQRLSYDGRGRLLLDGDPVSFRRTKTRKMFDYLVWNRGRWVSNEELLDEVWGDPSDANKSSLRVSRSEMVAILRAAGCEDLLSREWGWQGIFEE